MYYMEGKEIEVLLRLVTFANKYPGFDRTNIDKVYEFYMENDYVTEEQMKKLHRLYKENKIEELYPNED